MLLGFEKQTLWHGVTKTARMYAFHFFNIYKFLDELYVEIMHTQQNAFRFNPPPPPPSLPSMSSVCAQVSDFLKTLART